MSTVYIDGVKVWCNGDLNDPGVFVGERRIADWPFGVRPSTQRLMRIARRWAKERWAQPLGRSDVLVMLAEEELLERGEP